MNRIEKLAVTIGVFTGAMAWAQSVRLHSSPISVFPDLLTHGLFLLSIFGTLLYEFRRNPGWTRVEMQRATSRFGYIGGLVIAAITSVRALVQWSEPRYWMAGFAFPFTVLIVVVCTFLCGIAAAYTARRMGGAAASTQR